MADFAITVEEREEVFQLGHSQEFVHMPPYEVYASLLDQGRYLCSVRTDVSHPESISWSDQGATKPAIQNINDRNF